MDICPETTELELPGASNEWQRRCKPVPGLVVLSGPQLGRRFPLPPNECVLGRGPAADVRLAHRSLSRAHARLRCLDGGVYQIEDQGSRNGTCINGVRIEGPHLLQRGDRIMLGSRVVLEFVLEDQLDEQLVVAQKLEAVGRLSAGVTHDFNNLLTVLCANNAYLADLPGGVRLDDPDVQECLSEIRQVTERASELTGRLATLIRGRDDTSEHVDLGALCDEVVHLFSRVAPSNVHVECAIEPGLLVQGSSARLHPILLNPCVNARDAMPNGGTLRVELRLARQDELVSVQCDQAGDVFVVVSFSDDGVGMDEQTAKRIFNPFFTTKADAGGTGLGLAMVAQVARELGGCVDVESAPGHGTTLRIFLPRARAKQAVVDEPRPQVATRLAGAGARVLLVDDEALVARAAARALERAGYRIEMARDGLEALECFRASAPAVVVLDIDMPRMDGRTCYEELCKLDPSVKVIFMSGQGSVDLEGELLGRGATAFVPKPLDGHVLTRAIGRAIDTLPP